MKSAAVWLELHSEDDKDSVVEGQQGCVRLQDLKCALILRAVIQQGRETTRLELQCLTLLFTLHTVQYVLHMPRSPHSSCLYPQYSRSQSIFTQYYPLATNLRTDMD